MGEILVSVVCLAYNQENYIKDAIESFLMQKTNFTFEIIIHDDASTDKTRDIIREYSLKYPDVIKLIIQKENQYSKGERILKFIVPEIKGKYIAFCEGDDYWTDPSKLQLQTDYLESHPEYSMCVHAADRVSVDKTNLSLPMSPSKKDRTYSFLDILKSGGGFVATNSVFCRAKHIIEMPDFTNVSFGDYPLEMYLGYQGKTYYSAIRMSAYRVDVPGSWSRRVLSTANGMRNLMSDLDIMMDELNAYSYFKYDKIVRKTKTLNKFKVMQRLAMDDESVKDELRRLYRKLDIKIKIKIFTKKLLHRN
ncbi:MAG: glycosyltransferase [Clostridia bacterium]|jgi:glycosyltransferase involved in cell wall biosynthesis